MATNCFLCEQRSEDAQEKSSNVFVQDEDRWKKWLEAISKADDDVLAHLSLCLPHFSEACSAGLILTNNVIPSLKLVPSSSNSIAKAAEIDRSSPQRKPETERSSSLERSPTLSSNKSIVRRGRRVHMLTEDEMKEMPPIKYVRNLKDVNWDEISKVPEEAKIVWEVAMEELKEDNDTIKHLQAHIRQLTITVQKLKNALKTRQRRANALR
ncbi:uncharacterized protein LOC105434040 [Pogonomyrmex barbatus]|uniref:Uncharacterized protein LOC105434040 n=1 Tax=Pogonomyrmex barbatus TaxID=144034 RepID=A0A6I9XP84_9HYME|nr:uncharacterized protein LOC105434040 [Pogonomyrmex barbatus]